MPRITSKIVAALKGKNLLPREQILSFKSSLYGKEAKYFKLMPFYKCFSYGSTRMRNVRNERYAYVWHVVVVVGGGGGCGRGVGIQSKTGQGFHCRQALEKIGSTLYKHWRL